MSLRSANEQLLHDLNNALTVILGNARFLAKKLENSKEEALVQESSKRLATVQSAAERCASLVIQLQKNMIEEER